MRFFNAEGPIVAEDHYHVPPLDRLDLDELLLLVARKKYFVLHAPRQTGKTSALLALQELLNGGSAGEYRCVYVNVEPAQAAREDVGAAMRAILNEMAIGAEGRPGRHLSLRCMAAGPGQSRPVQRPARRAQELGRSGLEAAGAADRRDRHPHRRHPAGGAAPAPRRVRGNAPGAFPQSVVLCGVRDVRDYRIRSSSEKALIAGGSAFNVKAESLRLGDFSRDEVLSLLGQHTAETGQVFTAGALETVWEQSRGQPWLVNALAYEACESKAMRDRTRAVTAETILDAREALIERRATHLEQLTDKLEEERVRRVVEPLLSGEPDVYAIPVDDLQYVRDLGLIRQAAPVAIANPVYREVIPRELTWTTQEMVITHDPAWYVAADGRLLTGKLLGAFQTFFRAHSEHWVERFQYREAGPQLLLQAFLHRIVNSGGRVEREYGLGRMRVDLLVVWPVRRGGGDGAIDGGDAGNAYRPPAFVQKVVVECKVVRGSLDRTIAQGLEQTRAYMDRCGAEEGHLVVFDRTPGRTWEEKVFRREETGGGAPMTVWGM